MESLRPFTLQVADEAIADLNTRLDRARWPDEAPGSAWRYGSSVSFMRELVEHWRRRFDWRATEAQLNAWPQFKTHIDGIDLHFLHVPAQGDGPVKPLLLSHGWPGSVLEFFEIIPLLTAAGYTLVVPSLPGYGLSFEAGQPRKSLAEIGAIFHTLMHERLGYARYGAQGGDWGSFVSAWLAANRAEHLSGIHLNLLPLRRDAGMLAEPSPAGQRYLAELQAWQKEETGYQAIQGTRPQTLAFALADSPLGLAAWIGEKFYAWTDHQGDPRDALSLDRMLGNISLYWFTGCIGASFWPYYARLHGPWPIDGEIRVPMGYAEFPREILRPPREAAERVFKDIRRWSVMRRGGHFAAMEQPQALAAEVVAFFDALIA